MPLPTPLGPSVVRVHAAALVLATLPVALAAQVDLPGRVPGGPRPGPEAAPAAVTGRVLGPRGPLAGADVALLPPGDLPARRVRTGADGGFHVAGLAPGAWRLEVAALGYALHRRETRLARGDTLHLEVRLEAAAVELNPLVVTGTLSETRVLDSPVKVDVVSGRVLQRHAATSLMDGVGRINGLVPQVDCGVCYTNSIRINGMEGPYTAVLIDGMPVLGALASVYGLNGIHPSTVERLEILKGPQSTLYGTEAMGGLVNVITKDARFAPRLAVEASRSDLGEQDVALSWAPGSGRRGTLVGATLVHNDRFVDRNGDRFSDLTLDTRLNLFARTGVMRGDRRIGTLMARVHHEDRFGGLEEWTEADRGGREVYGESIRTRRAEVMGRLEAPWRHTRVEASYAFHDQDSYYGDLAYRARQHIGFAQMLWDPPRGAGRHDLLVGASLRTVVYDDETPATETAERRVIPGIFVEDQVSLSRALTLLGGLRVDHHESHGAIASPRASLMFRPDGETTLRLSAGTGFRVVSLFTEDHAALTGARQVVLEEALQPERSWSLAANLNRVFDFGANPMMLDVDLFHTEFSNRILADYDADPDLIVYRNLDGQRAVSRGVSVSVNQNFGADLPLLYTAGITVQDVFLTSPGGRVDELFAPDYRGVWSLSYTVPGGAGDLTLDYSGAVSGPMRLPAFDAPFTRPTRSPVFTTHDVQLTWAWAEGRQVTLGARNLTDFRQGSPLIDPGNPFGDAFDTSYFWGPVVGRRITVGLRWTRSR